MKLLQNIKHISKLFLRPQATIKIRPYRKSKALKYSIVGLDIHDVAKTLEDMARMLRIEHPAQKSGIPFKIITRRKPNDSYK